MKRLYTILIVLLLTAPFAAAQITTERCFHLDKVQFLQHKQDFWRSHKLFSTAQRNIPVSPAAITTSRKVIMALDLN